MHDQTTQATQKEPGSFLTGFTLGLLAGAVGHFLFTTDRGESVRSQLQKEWQHAQKEFHKQSAGEKAAEAVHEAGISLRDMAKKAVSHVSKMAEEEVSKKKTSSSKKAKSAKKTKKPAKNTFSGV